MTSHMNRGCSVKWMAIVMMLAWFVSLSVPMFAFGAERTTTGKRPNFIFILADDWGWGDLGCYGHRLLKTPNLDKLAKQGTRFTQFYVCSGVCSPSRTGFTTGQFPARHGIHGHLATPEMNARRGMPNALDPTVHTVARFLQEAGYTTAHIGKWHLGPSNTITKYGFDMGVSNLNRKDKPGPNRRARSTEWMIDDTIQFIESNRDKPFYVQTWLLDTHATLQPTEEQMKPYRHRGPQGVHYKGAMQIYYAAATAADQQIGRLLKKLDELGLAENTVVIFSSDNGPEDVNITNASHSAVGSAGPFRGRKRSLYEGGVRMPFIVRWPGKTPAGKVDNTSVISGADFLPTICTLAGVKLPDDLNLDGEDMSAALRGQPQSRTKPLMWEWRFKIFGHVMHQSPMLSIRDGKWKLLMNPDRSRIELYDIPNDPREMHNLAGRHPDVIEKLSTKVLNWQATLPKGPIEPEAGKNDYPWPG